MPCNGRVTHCKEGGTLEGNEVRSLVFLTLAFQTVFTAFNALQVILSVMLGLASKWVRLAPNWTNLGHFKISFL